MASLFITTALSLLNLGSSAAFNAAVSLLSSAAAFSYIISIGCVLIKRIRGQPLPPSRFDLGRWGIAVNTVSVLFMAAQVIIVMFPVTMNPTVQSMNYGCVMFGGVAFIAIVYYAVHGRKVYEGPVVRLVQAA
jgi:choline transport protein